MRAPDARAARAAAAERVAALAPVTLAELQASAPLRTRIDRKYVVGWEVLLDVLDRIGAGHRALEIDGRRAFGYDTVYFDSAGLGAYRAHMQRRRRRYKARSRRYVESDLHFFEVKLAGRRGETIKHQLPYRAADHGTITPEAAEFLAARLAEAYPSLRVPALAPALRTRYRRMTFAAGGERLTCDFDLRYSDATREVPGLDERHVILESKSARGLGAADRELRRLGVRPVACSKYCVGVSLLREDVKVNDLRWLLTRYFAWQPGAAAQEPA